MTLVCVCVLLIRKQNNATEKIKLLNVLNNLITREYVVLYLLNI